MSEIGSAPRALSAYGRARGVGWAAAASLELDDHGAAARLLAQAVAPAAPGKADELQRWGRANGLEA